MESILKDLLLFSNLRLMVLTFDFTHGTSRIKCKTENRQRKDSLAYLSMEQGQIPYFDVREQEETYRELIERLIYALTRDFRPTRRRL